MTSSTPALSITADQTSKLEGDSGTTPFTFTVTRSGSTVGTSSVSYAVSGGTANTADFGGTVPSGTVSFAAGETSKTITLNVSGDTTVEPDESFNVVLSSPVDATIGTGTASSTILNDDVAAPALSITADQTSKLEGDSGTTPFTFTVTRSGSTAGTSSVSYAVSGGTANAADFGGTLPSGTVSFAAGETSKTITVNVSGDTTVEPNESFNVVLSSPVGATIGTGTASSTILNDDVAAPALSITADQTSKLEGESGTTPFTFTVTRSGSTAGTSSVSYAVSGGTANAADFGGTVPSGTVSFAAGETSKTITVNVSGDTTVEPDESFNVVLSSPTGATIGTGTASSTILNDDVAAQALSITADQTSKLEGESGTTPFTFTVTRSGSTTGTSSVSYAVSGGTANAADFGGTVPSGTVSFAAGETSKTITVERQRRHHGGAGRELQRGALQSRGRDHRHRHRLLDHPQRRCCGAGALDHGRPDEQAGRRLGHHAVHLHGDPVGQHGRHLVGELRGQRRDGERGRFRRDGAVRYGELRGGRD